ncbi:uncharacterized protein [Rutidosis leptorrhynchoides]|uniref:uncharacterized protein n=1 Tax=Rutidosis leptorrhynchoides TaxID=125765 RepID=UPI003A9964E6
MDHQLVSSHCSGGDPLSPFLFIIAAEGLNILAKAACEKGLFKGIEVGGDKILISHLQYADDTIFIGFFLDDLDIPFRNSFKKSIGDGSSTSFWHDLWIGDKTLQESFPGLFRLDAEKEMKTSDRIEAAGNSVIPVWNWVRAPSGRTESNNLFTVKDLSSLIDEKLLASIPFAPAVMQNRLVPKKVEIFVWRLVKKRLPVRVEFDKRGIDLHSVRCPLCDDDLKTIDHTFIFCSHAMEIWSRVYKWWGLEDTLTNYSFLLKKWTINLGGKKKKKG